MKKKIIIGIVLILLAVFASRNVYERALGRSDDDGQRKFEASDFRGESGNISAKQNNQPKTELSFAATEETNVYDLMAKLQKDGKISFTEKNYAGLGKLIDSIGGLKSNGELTWIYYVNNTKASVGVSNYKLNPGDIVSWKYEKLLAY